MDIKCFGATPVCDNACAAEAFRNEWSRLRDVGNAGMHRESARIVHQVVDRLYARPYPRSGRRRRVWVGCGQETCTDSIRRRAAAQRTMEWREVRVQVSIECAQCKRLSALTEQEGVDEGAMLQVCVSNFTWFELQVPYHIDHGL